MNVLMLGWEYPPHISGGLGTACEGLTRALAGEGVNVTFIVPRAFGDEDARHMQLLTPDSVVATTRRVEQAGVRLVREPVEVIEVNSVLRPYQTPEQYLQARSEFTQRSEPVSHVMEVLEHGSVAASQAVAHYGGDLFSEVRRYATLTSGLAQRLDFDVIHAHDWMTYPAALEIRNATGRPLVVHVHSLEFDRSGEHVNQDIHRIEGAGIRGADRVIAVSHYTKGVIVRQHGVDPDKIKVVHNGVTRAEAAQRYHLQPEDGRPIVLFLGRITYQKGPEFFVRAAAKVLTRTKQVRFVMAGSGDMLEHVKHMVRELKIEKWFEFPGFVRGAELEKWFSLAECFVMPSRSEPFGITPLEALACDTPVIVSRQSGVSEVLRHALKADYWDVDRIAQLMLAVIRHDSLCADMLEMSSRELLRLHWRAAAEKTRQVYQQAVAG